MRLKPVLLVAVIAFTVMTPAAYAQEASAFSWFQTLCLETNNDPTKTVEAATRAGWQDYGGGFQIDGATVERIFTSPGQNPKLLMVMTVPASAINFDASGRVCLVGVGGADEAEMTRILHEWAGFSPENDGGFEFWAYSTVEGERRPERGLMDLPADELIARVGREGIQMIGVLPADGPAFATITPF